MKKCPYCAEEIQDEAIVCRFCGRELVQQVKPDEELVTKKQATLSQAIADYQAHGWILISNSGGVAQLRKSKSFNWFIFIIGILLLLIIAIIYLVAYAVKHEEIVTLTTDEQANLVVNGKVSLPVISKPQTPDELARSKKQKDILFVILGVLFVLFLVLVVLINGGVIH